MITIVAVLVALAVGLAVGWALRGTLAWCPRCGSGKVCPACFPQPLPADRRATGHARQGHDR